MQKTPAQVNAVSDGQGPSGRQFHLVGRVLRNTLLVLAMLAGTAATYIFYFHPFLGMELGVDGWIDEQRCLVDSLCNGPLYFLNHFGLLLAVTSLLLFAFGFSVDKVQSLNQPLSGRTRPLFANRLRGTGLVGTLFGALAIFVGLVEAYQLLIAKTQPDFLVWLLGIVAILLAGLFWDWNDDPGQARNTNVGLLIGVNLLLVILGLATIYAQPIMGIGLTGLGLVGFGLSVVAKSRMRSALAPIDYFSMLLFALVALFLGMSRATSWHYAFIGDEWTFYETARVLLDHPDVHQIFSTWDSLGYHSVLSLRFQAFIMQLAGTDVVGWKLSSLMPVILSVPALYIFLHWLAGRSAAFVGAGLFAASHVLLSFSMVAYNNTQALIPLAWGLGFFALAERRPSALRDILLGIALGSSFFAFSLGRLAVIPIGILLIICSSGNRWRLFERAIPIGLGGIMAAMPMLLNLDNWRSLLKATPVEHEVARQTSEVLLSMTSNVLAGLQAFLFSGHNTHFVYGSHADPLTAVLLLAGVAYAIRFAGQQRKIGAWLIASLLFWAAVAGIQQYDFVSTTRMFILPVVYATYAGIGAAALIQHFFPAKIYLRSAVLLVIVVAGILLNQNHIVKVALPKSHWNDTKLLVKQVQDSAASDQGGIPLYIVWASPLPLRENMVLRTYNVDRSRIRFLSPEEFLALPGFCASGQRATMALLYVPQPRINELSARVQACWPDAREVQIWNNVNEVRILQFTTPAGTEQLRLPPEQRQSWKSVPDLIPVSTGANVVVDQKGQTYVFSQEQGEILRYNLPDTRATPIELIQDRTHGLTVAPDGSLVVSSEANDKKLVWYDGETGEVLRRLEGNFGLVIESLAITPNGEIYLADFHGSQIWHLDSNGTVIRTYNGGGRVVEPVSLAITPDRSIWVLNARSGGLLHISPDDVVLNAIPFEHANQEAAPGLAINEDGSVFAVSPNRQRVELYSPDGQLLDVWGGFRWPTSLAIGPDGRFYVVDNDVRELAIVAGVSDR